MCVAFVCHGVAPGYLCVHWFVLTHKLYIHPHSGPGLHFEFLFLNCAFIFGSSLRNVSRHVGEAASWCSCAPSTAMIGIVPTWTTWLAWALLLLVCTLPVRLFLNPDCMTLHFLICGENRFYNQNLLVELVCSIFYTVY